LLQLRRRILAAAQPRSLEGTLFTGVSNCLEGSIFFTQEASFYPEKAISAANLKLTVIICFYLS